MSGMLAENLGARDVEIIVVNPWPDSAVETLEFLGVKRRAIRTIASAQAIEDFVEQLERSASERLVAWLLHQDADCYLVVAGGEARAEAVIGADPTKTGVELLVDRPLNSLSSATRARGLQGEPEPITLGQLAPVLATSPSDMTVTFVETRERCRIIDHAIGQRTSAPVQADGWY